MILIVADKRLKEYLIFILTPDISFGFASGDYGRHQDGSADPNFIVHLILNSIYNFDV